MITSKKQPSDSKIAIYIRLSREDGDKIESESVGNQRKIIQEFISKYNGKNFVEYIDDGYTGINFNRPRFKELLKDIDTGMINTVITKDLSRLGRDYIQVGEYLEKIFPEKAIRYIAILDNIDTYLEIGEDQVPIKALVNDMYSKDISKKLTSVKAEKRKRGMFYGTTAPFGYKKDTENKGKLIIDEEAARIVKKIFDLKYDGVSLSGIVDKLQEEKVPTPGQYMKIKGHMKNEDIGIWKKHKILSIIHNEVYIGSMVLGKTKKINYKSKRKVPISKKDWTVVPIQHEPIIEKEIFYAVQYKGNIDTKPKESNKLLLKPLMYCSICGKKMFFNYLHKNKKETSVYMWCSRNRQNKDLCNNNENINYYKIEELVLENLKNTCNKYLKTMDIKNIFSDKLYKETRGESFVFAKQIE